MTQLSYVHLKRIQKGDGCYMSPFVCQNNPSVCSNPTLIYPFIVKNKPFVCFAKFLGGFNIIELMVVVVIIGIMAALAVPGMNSFIQNQRLSGQTNEMLGDLAYARSEAIRRQARIVICKTADPNAASPACDTTAANAWTAGRLTFVDDDADGLHDNAEAVLRVRQRLEGSGNKLNGDGSSNGTANRITFLGSGLTTLVPLSGASENQMFLCDNRGPGAAFAIVISPTGRARIAPKGKNMNDVSLTSAACP